MFYVFLFVLYIITLYRQFTIGDKLKKEYFADKQRHISEIKNLNRNGKTVIDTSTELQFEYLNNTTYDNNKTTDFKSNKESIIWQVKMIHHIKSYNDITPRLTQYKKLNDYENIMSLLDLLSKLNVNTGEILDDNPNILNDVFSNISKQSLRTQIV